MGCSQAYACWGELSQNSGVHSQVHAQNCCTAGDLPSAWGTLEKMPVEWPPALLKLPMPHLSTAAHSG